MLPAPRQVIINGKFLSAESSGVRRVAVALVKHCHRLLAEEPELSSQISMQLWVPGSAAEQARALGVPYQIIGPFDGRLWEHATLPAKAGSRLILSLCNVGPLPSRHAVTLIHDAQIYMTPKSYTLPYRIWHRFQQTNIGHRHARILTVSEFSRRQLAGYGVTKKDRIGVVLNGVDHGVDISPDPTILDQLDLRAGKYVLALANIKAHKNIGVLLRAFARPALVDIPLILFGADGRTQFEQQGMSIPQNVRFAGKIDDAQLRALYKSALCLAFPSLTEGFGLPPLEAMREGCPSVVSPTGALPEVCGDAAIYADPHDPAAWAAEILKLSNDVALRQTLVQRGKEQAARFTWDKAARTLIRELMSI